MVAREKGLTAGSSPNLTDFINVANIAYSQPGVGQPFPTMFPDDLKLLMSGGKPVTHYDAATGFYGAAFVTPRDQVIVGFEGTNLYTGNDVFTAAQVIDDTQIYFGTNALSYKTSLNFTKTAIKDAMAKGIPRSGVFVDGHSLGAADAEYVAAKTGLAGTTFGTPGTPVADSRPGHPSKLTNYVEKGDPVGNYAAGSPLGPIVFSNKIQHFGGEKVIGTDPLGLLPNAATDYASGNLSGALFNLGLAIPNHYLAQYASDLGVQLGSADLSVGADSGFFAPLSSLSSPPVCFSSGTLIRTRRGDVAVEALRVGDRAVTASGGTRPIVWIGHRIVDCAAHPTPSEVWPVRVRAGAFGSLPERDLFLSPGHPVLVGDGAGQVLVPIMCLINGTSIARMPVDAVTYWHVELDEHDILLAEGLPAESFLDYGNRPWFDNGADHTLTNPDFIPSGLGARCRPVAIDGHLVEAERRRVEAIFETSLAAQCAWPATDEIALSF